MKIFSMALLGLWLSLSANAQEVSKYAKVYKGEEGVVVTIAILQPLEKKQALIKIEGIDSKWDNKIFLSKVKGASNNGSDYTISTDDHPTYVLITERNNKFTLYVDDVKNELPIKYNEEESKKANTQTILNEYKKQK